MMGSAVQTIDSPPPVVLIADGHMQTLAVLGLKLGSFGLKVAVAQDGAQALELVQMTRPKLIVADHNLRRLSGIELAQRVRHLKQVAQVPFILTLAAGAQVEPAQLARFGIAHTLVRPFSPRMVCDLVLSQLVEQAA